MPRQDHPSSDCARCPRLAAFRAEQRAAHPLWFNAPVPPFGDPDAWLAIVGLAPGLRGANRTGRAFTGDGSGAMLFAVLAEHGLASGDYAGRAGDGLTLHGAIIVNAIRCAPPANRPTAAEIGACRDYLAASLAALPRLRAVVALGHVAHRSALGALGCRPGGFRFAHGAEHRLGQVTLIDSYHCSRYNQNIGRIDHKMLWSAFGMALRFRPGGCVTSPKNIAFAPSDDRERA